MKYTKSTLGILSLLLVQMSWSEEPLFMYAKGDSLLGLLTVQAKEIVEPKYTYWGATFGEHVLGYYSSESIERIDVYDIHGNPLLNNLGEFRAFTGESGALMVQPLDKNAQHKYQIVDGKGNAVTAPVYDSILDDWWDHFTVKKGRSYQLVDFKGKVKISSTSYKDYWKKYTHWYDVSGSQLGGGIGGIAVGMQASPVRNPLSKSPLKRTTDSLVQEAVYDSVCPITTKNSLETDWAVVRKGSLLGIYNLKNREQTLEPRYTQLIPVNTKYKNFCLKE